MPLIPSTHLVSIAGVALPATPSPPPPIPYDLADAVDLAIQTNLVNPGILRWFGTGVAPEVLPDGSVLGLPYATLSEPDESDSYSTTLGDSQADGHLEISIYSGDKLSCRSIAKRVAAAINDASLAFQAGTLIYLRQVARSMSLDPDPGPGGEDCWQEVRSFRYVYCSNLSESN